MRLRIEKNMVLPMRRLKEILKSIKEMQYKEIQLLLLHQEGLHKLIPALVNAMCVMVMAIQSMIVGKAVVIRVENLVLLVMVVDKCIIRLQLFI
jgi:hypothetical protein